MTRDALMDRLSGALSHHRDSEDGYHRFLSEMLNVVIAIDDKETRDWFTDQVVQASKMLKVLDSAKRQA